MAIISELLKAIHTAETLKSLKPFCHATHLIYVNLIKTPNTGLQANKNIFMSVVILFP